MIGLLMAVMLAADAAPVDIAAERAALARADKAWSEAAVARDVEKALTYWADDAVIYPPGGPVVSGKDAIRKFVTDALANPGFAIRWQTSAFEVSASGDMAYGVGTNTITMTDAQGKAMTERGKSVTVWRKGADGRWRCV